MTTENTATPSTVAPKVVAEIIRGRMPIAVVHQIRFGDQKGEATKTLATMFGTTVGKIDDIKKNRNFSYVTATFVPTQAQKDEGIAWLQKHPKFSDGSVDKLINELEATPVATAEDAAAFEAIRTAARGQKATNADGTAIAAGGGNRTKAPKKATAAPVEGAPAAGEPNAADLLA
jgi:hypothetical protein